MALNHKRTVGSINMKLLSIAESFITNEGKDIKDVSKIVNISEKIILDHVRNRRVVKKTTEIKRFFN